AANAQARAHGHLRQQRGHGALAVGTRDARDRRPRGAREQLDIPDDGETLGETTSNSAPSSSEASKPPRRTTISRPSSVPSALRRGHSGGSARLSVTATSKPCASRYRAAEKPLLPRPTTTARALAWSAWVCSAVIAVSASTVLPAPAGN